MTDYAGEQAMEIEALQAIYMDDLQEYSGSVPFGWVAVDKTYQMDILPFEEGEEVDGTAQEDLKMELLFAHTPQYPDEAPSILVRSIYGLTDAEVARCTAEVQKQIEENKGMAMIYTLISTTKEWLRNRASQTAEEDPAIAAKRAIAEEEARRQAARAHGTAVTPESFKAWKAKFDAELAAEKAKTLETLKDDDKAKRISGKAWFMQDRSEVATEAGALSEDDEEDFDEDDENAEEAEKELLDDDDDDDEFEDYDDDDDEGMLDEL